MMIFRVNNGKFVNWAAIVYSQLVKDSIRWDKYQKNTIEGTTKRETKNDVCHPTIVLEGMFQKWFPLEVKSQKKKKHA